MANKILFIEDEQTIAMAVTEVLLSTGYEVMHTTNGEEALMHLHTYSASLCILDVMLPGMNGFETAVCIKKTNPLLPILFLTARTEIEDVLHGFRLGGSDYLRKPFSLQELLARIKAILERPLSGETNSSVIYFQGYVFDRAHQLIQKPDKEKHTLSHREAELLYLLLLHKNNILNRREALLGIWGDDTFFNARTMDVFISRLRKYFKNDPSIQIINIRGVGYKLLVDANDV
jgi:DNA-binding response OmpR family regulator